MRQFIELIRKNKELRLEVETALSDSFKDFLLASAIMSPEMLDGNSFSSKTRDFS